MYQHILFATDLREISNGINKKVLMLTTQLNAKLSLVHTIEPVPAYTNPGFVDLEQDLIAKAKEQMSLLGFEMHVPEARQYIEFGSVKNEVLRVAKELNVDIIVVGSHGRHGLSRLLGSSANSIANGAECDVLTIRYHD